MSLKIIFMGTPDFAVNVLEELLGAPYEITCVVTQPDKPKGRGKAMQCSPVKECALAHDIPVFQPVRIREPEAVEELGKYEADLIVVVAFGQILPKEILEMTRLGCINVHASLLPKYRGAAPIQWAVINGEKESGVTIQQMNEGIDTGDIIAYRTVALAEDETGGSLFDKLAREGAQLCRETVDSLANGSAHHEPQDEAEATYTQKLDKKLGNIDWEKPAAELERLVRGLNPWPSAYTYLDGKNLKIWKAYVGDDLKGAKPGMFSVLPNNILAVQTGQGSLVLEEIQIEGKKRMKTEEFLRGYHLPASMQFFRER